MVERQYLMVPQGFSLAVVVLNLSITEGDADGVAPDFVFGDGDEVSTTG